MKKGQAHRQTQPQNSCSQAGWACLLELQQLCYNPEPQCLFCAAQGEGVAYLCRRSLKGSRLGLWITRDWEAEDATFCTHWSRSIFGKHSCLCALSTFLLRPAEAFTMLCASPVGGRLWHSHGSEVLSLWESCAPVNTSSLGTSSALHASLRPWPFIHSLKASLPPHTFLQGSWPEPILLPSSAIQKPFELFAQPRIS